MKAVIGHTQTRQVAFVGPFGVGKSTAVRAISDTEVVNTDVLSAVDSIPRPGSPRKRTTTVGLDYGEWHGQQGQPIAVVGTPGQERFQTMRASAAPRADAVVLWLFGDHAYGLEEAQEWIEFLGDKTTWQRMTLAVTRLGDEPNCPTLSDYLRLGRGYHAKMAVVAADPRQRTDVERVVDTALRTAPAAKAAAKKPATSKTGTTGAATTKIRQRRASA